MYNYKFLKLTPFPNLSLNSTDGFSCGALRCPGWKRSCHKGGTPTSPPGVPFLHGHRQLPMRLMGPLCSLQPGTGTLAWCPPVEFWGVAYVPVCLPLKLEWQLEGQTQWPGLQDWKLQVLWTLERAAGRQGNWGLNGIFSWGVERGEGGNMRWLPSRVHRSLLPLIL